MIHKNAKIAKSAVIKDGANIGANVTIGEFCVIGEKVSIQEGSFLYNNVTILGNTSIGKNNQIFPNATIGSIPQDLKYNGEDSVLIIGDNNLIRESCMFNTGTLGGGMQTKIGSNNLFMGFVHIAHDCIVGDNNIFSNNATLGGHVEVGNRVNISGLSAVHQFCKIGDYSMIGAMSLLSQDVPPFCLAVGNRAKILGLNKHRLREFFSRDVIDSISSFYKPLLKGEISPASAAKQYLSQDLQISEIKEICEFILNSQRGIPFKKGEINE